MSNMSNRIFLVISILLGISVIAICIYKSTTLRENYNINYEDVIPVCNKKELKKSKYKINDIVKILNKYNLEKSDINIISEKLNEKGYKGQICHRALKLVFSTYLIYYKPIFSLIINELSQKKLNKNKDEQDNNHDDEDEDNNHDEQDNNHDEQDNNHDEKDNNHDEQDNQNNQNNQEVIGIENNNNYMEYKKEKNKNISFGTLKKMFSLLKSDGLITDYNEESMLRYYSNKSIN